MRIYETSRGVSFREFNITVVYLAEVVLVNFIAIGI